MTAPKSIKLYYFNARGRAELIRWIMLEGGWRFEDKRVSGEEWAKLKPESPYGSMPWLDMDGKILCETVAQANFVAQETGLIGDSTFEGAQGTMITIMANDILTKMGQAMRQSGEAKEEMITKIQNEIIPKFFTFCLKKKGDKEWIMGAKMTLADLAMTWLIDEFGQEEKDNARRLFPEVMAIHDKVVGSPKIKHWIAKRPITSF